MARVSLIEDIEDARQEALQLRGKIEVKIVPSREAEKLVNGLLSRCNFIVETMDDIGKLKSDLSPSTQNRLYQLKLEKQEAVDSAALLDRQLKRARRERDELQKKLVAFEKPQKPVAGRSQKPKGKKPRSHKLYFRA